MKKLLLPLSLCLLLSVSGCAQLGYYAQAVEGQVSVLSRSRPIDQWLADPAVTDDLKSRLRRTQRIRAFAAETLGLPDNGSYKNYADLKRKYVMWNVVATPQLSMKPQQWCFPVAGCVDYRGYYSKDAAEAFAAGLQRQGFDVRVSGVPAYSTLGWFNDPVLSTFIAYPEAEVARMVFHELAHQVAYAPGDSQFNESFATAVEELGVARWLDAQGSDQMREDYRLYHQRKQDFIDLLDHCRRQLEDNYARAVSDTEKRARKAQLIEALRQDYETLKAERWASYAGYDRWFDGAVTNAHFVLVATYHDLVPAFRRLQASSNGLGQFYREVRQLAKLHKAERRTQLARHLPLPPDVPESSSPTATAASQ
jgi:predicted aminopeptidase